MSRKIPNKFWRHSKTNLTKSLKNDEKCQTFISLSSKASKKSSKHEQNFDIAKTTEGPLSY